ncbi:YadA-like family protein [Paraburkholderia acidisoli]|uniref:Autotransporter adhesin n=1 Tax=Paraburkholderia acidisoli TaxID=2571748 RepID=A0A7Z2GH98_9BURK|nr:YadA-like family protein [Paraburkholderia acidisoli]QGZ61390.1 hypothetical protein FAZ98_06400 [Paraburkholderia acidisoli]
MNRSYRSVWNHGSQTWVAAPETSKARSKSARCIALLATGAAGIAASLAPAMVAAATPGTVGKGSLQLCSGASGYAWGNSGGNEALDCSTDGKGTTDGMTFSLNNAGDGKGGYGFGASTARVTGYQNGTLALKGASIMVYGPTTFDSVVTMSNQKIVQLAPGLLAASSTEAVNGSQLYATNENVTNLSNTINNFINKGVKYFHVNSTGADSSATGVNGTAIGTAALASGTNSVSIGSTSTAAGQSSVVLSSNAKALGDWSEAMGNGAIANKLGDMALGASSNASGGGTVNQYATAVGTNATASAAGTVAVGSNAGATGGYATAIGSAARASGPSAIALGQSANSSSTNAIAIGNQANATGFNSAALGASAQTLSNGDAAFGTNAYANGTGAASSAAAMGYAATASGTSASAIGGNSKASAAKATALGQAAQATGANSTALGQGAQALAASSIALGEGSVANTTGVATANGVIGGTTYTYAGGAPVGVVSVGTTTAARQITNVAAGQVTAASTDVINGSQLFATNSKVTQNTTDISSLDSEITNINGQMTDVVKYDSSAHTTVTLGGVGSPAVALTNLKPGELSASSTDAVNGAQLYGVSQTVTNVSTDITKIHNTLVTSGWGAQAQSSDPTAFKMGGYIMDANGNVSNPSVLYVPNTIGTANAHIVLDPGQGNSNYFVDPTDRSSGALPRGTVISNVADGILDTDATNVGQVEDLISKKSGVSDLHVSSPMLLKATGGVGAAAPGSGVDLTDADGGAYRTAAYYSQVRGATNAVGSSAPTDMARANAAGSIAIGSNTEANGGGSVALGIQSLANANDSVALGSGSVANQDNTVSVGSNGTSQRLVVNPDGSVSTIQSQLNTRRIVNMAAGQDDTDAVNVSQLRSVAGALGGGAGINAAGAFIAPSYAVGGTTVNTVGDAIANLDNRVTQNTADIAALNNGIAASDSTAVQASSPRVLAAARPLLAAGDTADTATDANAVHYDSNAHDTVTLASTAGGNVKLSGLQDGSLDAASTDAVTGKQLYATNQQVATINQMVQNIATTGSTAVAVNSDSGPAAASGASAFAAGGGAVATGASSTAIGDKANASATNSVAIGANSIANRDNAVSVGAEGAERQIVNVKAGTSGTDAVNLNQMNSAMTQQSNVFNQQISSLQSSINTVSKNAYAGVAAAMAMPNLTPSGPGRTVVAAGGGYYKGGSAAAVGVTYRSTSMHWLMNGAVSVTSTGDAGVRAQVGYEF